MHVYNIYVNKRLNASKDNSLEIRQVLGNAVILSSLN